MLVKRLRIVAFLMMLFALVGCDPYRTAKRLLQDQGFVLLQPARDYVVPGGIVVVDENGVLQYLDPPKNFDTSKLLTAAVNMAYDHDQSAPLDLALGLTGELVALPVGFKMQGGSQLVTLDAIDIQSVRISRSLAEEFLSRENTISFMKTQLDHTRAFSVQEVLTVKSMKLKSASGEPLRIASDSSLPECSVDGEARQSSQVNRKDVPTVSMCKNGRDEITLDADKPIPVAVRLAEIRLTSAGDALTVNPVSSISGIAGIVSHGKRSPW